MWLSSAWDHPRIRGKDRNYDPVYIATLGSPPHTRERLPFHAVETPAVRITPAYAGKTLDDSVAMNIVEDHPRIRGKD